MKAILEFDLQDESDAYTHELMFKSKDLKMAICDIEQAFRKIYKYGQDRKDVSEFEEMRDKFYEIINEYNINLD